ncbi:MAG: hypothetical protein GC204_01580 [Chloroflexi bacterium]|nr:hypothetical protein [Chloroflexota bacterium]
MSKSTRAILLGFSVSLFTVLAVYAQSATQQTTESVDSTQFVTRASAKLTNLNWYSFSYNSTHSTTLTDKNGNKTVTAATYRTLGDVAGSSSDTRIWINVGERRIDPGEWLLIERLVTDGTTYIHLQTANTPYAGLFNVDDGWWRYDDLSKAITNSQTAIMLDNAIKLPMPSELFSSNLITSVQDLGDGDMYGRHVRVFTAELNTLKILFQESPITDMERLTQIFQQTDILKASHLNTTLRLFIGTDDDQIYRAEAHSETDIPYLTVGHVPDYPYDVETGSLLVFDITGQGTPVTISAPTNLHSS